MYSACEFVQRVLDHLDTHSGNVTVSVGTVDDTGIRELAETVREVLEHDGRIYYDKAKPDGTPRKLLDV